MCSNFAVDFKGIGFNWLKPGHTPAILVCPVLLCHIPSENIYLFCGQQMFKYQDTSRTALLSIIQLAMVKKQ